MKRVPITDTVVAALERTTKDDSFDTSRIDVFEAVFVTSAPLRAAGLFKGSRITRSGLEEMANWLNSDRGGVPIHISHNTSGSIFEGDPAKTLPVGRAISGAVFACSEPGVFELRGQFYIDKVTHPDLIAKIESSTISAVSVGAKFNNGISNKSGFNFLAEGNEFYAFNAVDPEGNAIGTDGHHIMLSGLDYFYETSLVSVGASEAARIVSSGHFKLAAATAHDVLSTVVAISGPVHEPELPKVTELTAEVGRLKATVSDLEGAKVSLANLQAELAALNEKLTTATAELEAFRAENDAATKIMKEHAVAAATAANLMLKPDASLADMSETIKLSAKKLHTVVPVGGVSQPQSSSLNAPGRPSAFKLRS